ncbi:MAG: cytochrome c, partial [Nitrospinota bacterium]
MKRLSRLGGCALLLSLLLAGMTLAQTKPPESPENVARGEEIYQRRCWFCHGLEGDGNGPVADYLDPRPRDFTLGSYKLRTTESGEPP